MTPVLVIACGAIARELRAVQQALHADHWRIHCIDAALHNRPAAIAPAVAELLARHGNGCDAAFVALGDCGTGGALDALLRTQGVERLPGAHCYAFLAGEPRFEALMAAEPGTFFLTDFLVRHFDRLVRRGLGLDRHPDLRNAYFGNYRRLVYLAQQPDARLDAVAAEQARFLGLAYERLHTGLQPLREALPPELLQWQG